MALKILKEGEEEFIYTLTDPNSGLIRYIGKTMCVVKRFKEHIKKSKLSKTHKNNWINSLLKNNQQPIIEVIDTVDIKLLNFYEIYWIDQFRTWGFSLTNEANGGGGGNLGSIVNKKISEKLKNRVFNQKTIEKMSLSKIGTKHSVTTKELMSKQKLGEKNNMYGKKRDMSCNNKPIQQLDFNNNLINEWGSIKDVSKQLKISRQLIGDVLHKRKWKKSAGGYKWVFKTTNNGS